MSENESMRWYVIHTYSGHENKVKTTIEKTIENLGLGNLIERVVIPEEKVVETKNGVEKIRKKKIFPGYVLLKMKVTDDTWYLVRNTKGVTGFIGTNNKPIPLTNEEVIKMQLEDEAQPVYDIDVEVGDEVIIKSGAFADRTAIVNKVVPEKQLIKAAIHMFGKDTVIELEFNQVQKL